MIALDAALRRLTVCQLTHESRGNGGGLRPRVWLRLRAAAGGNWTPDGTLQLEGEANFSCLGAHEALPKATLLGLFSKIEWAPAYVGSRPAVDGDFDLCATRFSGMQKRVCILAKLDRAVPAGHGRWTGRRQWILAWRMMKHALRQTGPAESGGASLPHRSTTQISAAIPAKHGHYVAFPMADLIRWSIQEIRRIAQRLAQKRIQPADIIAWSLWRRAHQAAAQKSHIKQKSQL
jgi:hypothetical protein